MAAPKGNKFAEGCSTSGRPRTVSPSKEELIELGKEMLAWVKANKPLHLREFYTLEKGMLWEEYKELTRFKEFLPYHEKCIAIVGRQYIDGTVNPSISQRWQRIYFRDLREEEDETARFNSQLKAQEQESVSELAKEQMNALLSQIRDAQSKASQ